MTQKKHVRIIAIPKSDCFNKRMEYFINQKFHFDAQNGTIDIIGCANPPIQLSKPSSRLLTELVIHSGLTLSREELLLNVWEEHGLTPSTSNLSNHISFLRKIFLQLGEPENIIITVPKEGFKLAADVTFFPSEITREKVKFYGNKKENNAITVKKENIKQRNKTLFYSAIFFITFLSGAILLSLHNLMPHTDVIDKCQILEIPHDSHEYRNEKIKLLNQLIRKYKINCNNGKSIIYYNFTNTFPYDHKKQKNIFISQCEWRSKNNISHCDNYVTISLKKP